MHTTNPPVTATEKAQHSAKDKVLAHVYTCVQHNSWNARKHSPFSQKKGWAYIARWVCIMGEKSCCSKEAAITTTRRAPLWVAMLKFVEWSVNCHEVNYDSHTYTCALVQLLLPTAIADFSVVTPYILDSYKFCRNHDLWLNPHPHDCYNHTCIWC